MPQTAPPSSQSPASLVPIFLTLDVAAPSGYTHRRVPGKGAIDGIAVVLGYANGPDGELHSESQHRCMRALELNQTLGYGVALTGGFGGHFNTSPHPHYEYTRRFLLSRGLPEAAIVCMVASSNTIEDATMLLPWVQDLTPSKLMIVTSDFHRDRAELVFRDVMSICRTCDVEMSVVESPEETRERHKSHETKRFADMKQLIAAGGILAHVSRESTDTRQRSALPLTSNPPETNDVL